MSKFNIHVPIQDIFLRGVYHLALDFYFCRFIQRINILIAYLPEFFLHLQALVRELELDILATGIMLLKVLIYCFGASLIVAKVLGLLAGVILPKTSLKNPDPQL